MHKKVIGDKEMLRNNGQMKMSLSPYAQLYDIIVPQEHLLRRIKENIDFSFVNPMLKKQYCEHYGRPAKEPEMMFKLLFLKKLYDLSDERLISAAQTDMAYKYFLDMEPEDKMIDSSLLTKFRKTRITEDILEEMLKETITQAIQKGIIKSGTIIVDSTHTTANVRPKSVTQVLRDLSKQLRKEIYKSAFELSERFPEKPSIEANLNEETEYTKKLLTELRDGVEKCNNQKIKDIYKRIDELLKTEKIKEIRSKDDEDARFGHKTASSTFFGYKSHIAMTDDRIITAVEVTDGAEPDGKQLTKLIEKTTDKGLKVSEVIGDMAYVSEDNLKECEDKEITLYAKTNAAVATAAANNLEQGFCFNKDAGLMQCPCGELATRFEKRKAKNGNTYLNYCFSIKKCKNCALKDKCRVGLSKSKTYSITQPNEKNKERLDFESTEDFNNKLKIRHRIEEKNGEMKTAHGMDRADSTGLVAMRLQAYLTAFVVNVKRITTVTAKISA